MDDLKSKAKEHDKQQEANDIKLNQIHDKVESSNKIIKELEERINHQEDCSRRKNIRISGMEERGSTEAWEQTAVAVTTLPEEKMELPGVVLERAHRVGPNR